MCHKFSEGDTIKAIIFDCFGVLYPDTYWTMAHEFLGDSLEQNRAKLHDLVNQVDMGYITRDDLWEQFGELVGQTKEEVYTRLEEFSGLDKRLLAFIDEHKATHKIGMISNVGKGFIERMFVAKPANEYFDSIILSSDVGLVKPDVRIYELAALKLGVKPEECVFIDDLVKNAEGARQAGMKAITYKNYGQFMREIETIIQ